MRPLVFTQETVSSSSTGCTLIWTFTIPSGRNTAGRYSHMPVLPPGSARPRVMSSSFSWSSPWLWLNYFFNGVSKIKVQGFSDLYFVDKENIFHHGILNIAFNTTDIIYDYINQIFINEWISGLMYLAGAIFFMFFLIEILHNNYQL